MITFRALEPSTPHPNSKNETIYDVAMQLEEDFHVVESFFNFIEPKIYEKFEFYLEREEDITSIDFRAILFKLSEWCRNEWRQFIIQEKHGIKTKASRERGGKSFVDTTAYFLNMLTIIGEEND